MQDGVCFHSIQAGTLSRVPVYVSKPELTADLQTDAITADESPHFSSLVF